MSGKASSHWVWEAYSTERGIAFATEMEGFHDDVQIKVLRGERIRRPPKITVTATTAGRFRDNLGSPVGMFVSPILKRVLEETAGVHAQFFEVAVRGQKRVYYLLNVLDVIPAIDLEKSSYDLAEGSDAIMKFHRLRLRPIAADAPPVFHAAESASMVFVSDALRRKLLQASDHAGVFFPAEQFPRQS